MTFTPEQLGAIFSILVEECGADPTEKEAFVSNISQGCQEYRCCWALGFGGKFYPEYGHVSYYIEDQTPRREAICERTNNKLKQAFKIFRQSGEK